MLLARRRTIRGAPLLAAGLDGLLRTLVVPLAYMIGLVVGLGEAAVVRGAIRLLIFEDCAERVLALNVVLALLFLKLWALP